MKFARREGVQVMLVTLRHSVRGDLLEHADLLLEIPPTARPHRAKSEVPSRSPAAARAPPGCRGSRSVAR
jgi:hypothetical protein